MPFRAEYSAPATDHREGGEFSWIFNLNIFFSSRTQQREKNGNRDMQDFSIRDFRERIQSSA
jgi:hypothetical protein